MKSPLVLLKNIPIVLGETSCQVKSYLAAGQEVGLWHRQDGVFSTGKHHGMVGLWWFSGDSMAIEIGDFIGEKKRGS